MHSFLPFENGLRGILTACWRIGSWLESLTRPRPWSLLEVVRNRAITRQWEGAIARGQWRLNARKIAGHGSVMPAEIRGVEFVGDLRIIESTEIDEGRNVDKGVKEAP